MLRANTEISLLGMFPQAERCFQVNPSLMAAMMHVRPQKQVNTNKGRREREAENGEMAEEVCVCVGG